MNNLKDMNSEDPRLAYPGKPQSRSWKDLYNTVQRLPSNPPTNNRLPYQPPPLAEPKPSAEHSNTYSAKDLKQLYNMPTNASSVPIFSNLPPKAPPMLTNSQPTKFQKKVFFPTNTGINYIGLLIGPKGMYQKKLEEQTGCKILIRGKYLERAVHRGTQKGSQQTSNESEEDQHVLVFVYIINR